MSGIERNEDQVLGNSPIAAVVTNASPTLAASNVHVESTESRHMPPPLKKADKQIRMIHFAELAVHTAFQSAEQIKLWRKQFFYLGEEYINMTAQQHAAVFPLIANLWVRHNITTNSPCERINRYNCRLFRKQQKSVGKGLRNRKVRDAYGCHMKLKVTEYFAPNGIPLGVVYQRYGDSTQHNHTLEDVDREKRPKVLMNIEGHNLKRHPTKENIYNSASPGLDASTQGAPPTQNTASDSAAEPNTAGTLNDASRSCSDKHPDFKIIMAPFPWLRANRNPVPALFLSGSIERGAADWRNLMARALKPYPVTILNPHRSDWDSTWTESVTCTPFREQVHWELDMIERADLHAVYFATSTDAPITLMEFGLMAKRGRNNVKVCAPEGYSKRGNVQIMCAKYKLEFTETLEQLVEAVQRRLQEWQEQETLASTRGTTATDAAP